MADFTEAELAYIDLFNKFKSNNPKKDVSVFQQPITNREELLNTIIARHPKYYGLYLASFYNFEITPEKSYLQGRQKPQYNYQGDTYPFWKFTTLKQFTDFLCTVIINYVPHLRLPDASQLLSTTENTIKPFLIHYEKSIRLLLDGPPHANQHTINPKLAAKWVESQKTPERRRLAKLLIDNTIYISHKELLEQIQACVEKTREKLVDGPVTFIVGTIDKSNYYISLLFYHFWIKAGLHVDAVKSHMDGLVVGNLLDIDEMAYSGSQTTNTLGSVYTDLIDRIRVRLIELNAATVEYNTELPIQYSEANKKRGFYGESYIPWSAKEGTKLTGILAYKEPANKYYIVSYAKSKIFLPLMLVESILNSSNINYIVIRIFCSQKGQKALLEMPPKFQGSPPKQVKPPFHLIIGKVLPSPETIFGKEDALKLGFLFAAAEGYPAAPVYFNHKVADLPSTYLNPYAFGVIPDKLLFGDPYDEENTVESLTSEERAIYNSLENPHAIKNSDTTTFLPFIEYCEKDLRPMPCSRKNLFKYIPHGQVNNFRRHPQLPQVFRCPYAWYKNIDYDKGKYTPPPELRNRGGTRRVKHRSTKRRLTHRKHL
jgi:hypothetical protein